MIGFDTIGNATLIAYDDLPILATDPWTQGGAYFGSWSFSHAIPSEQLESIKRCRYLWFSHGHPDHLNPDSLGDLENKELLLANHVGGRIYSDLTAMGLNVRILPERQWVQLSKRIRVLTLSDFNQDSILLVDINGVLLMDINDANERGWGMLVKRIARRYKTSYMLKLGHYGDADMINLLDEEGQRIPPLAASRPSVGKALSRWAGVFGANHVIPFSSFHQYQREDSIWANEYVTPLTAYAEGFDSTRSTLLPAFVRVDCETGHVKPLDPPMNTSTIRAASEFGDNWAEPLERADKQKLTGYVQAKQTLRSQLGFLRFLVGGDETVIDLNPRLRPFGITFAVPRTSLMAAIEYQIFDDLLIGNFMRTTLHGGAKLYPHFTPFVAKWSDNGKVNTKQELRHYFLQYFRRAPVNLLLLLLEAKSEDIFRKMVPSKGKVCRKVQSWYWKLK
jgi:hypothetical protein